MTNKNNIGEAILFLGLIALNIWYPSLLLQITSVILGAYALWTWHSVETDKKTQEIIRNRELANIKLIEAKTDYYKSMYYTNNRKRD
jgi:NADH:ubiquinone oxidoreductase subunit 4 (subunit M)